MNTIRAPSPNACWSRPWPSRAGVSFASGVSRKRRWIATSLCKMNPSDRPASVRPRRSAARAMSHRPPTSCFAVTSPMTASSPEPSPSSRLCNPNPLPATRRRIIPNRPAATRGRKPLLRNEPSKSRKSRDCPEFRPVLAKIGAVPTVPANRPQTLAGSPLSASIKSARIKSAANYQPVRFRMSVMWAVWCRVCHAIDRATSSTVSVPHSEF